MALSRASCAVLICALFFTFSANAADAESSALKASPAPPSPSPSASPTPYWQVMPCPDPSGNLTNANCSHHNPFDKDMMVSLSWQSESDKDNAFTCSVGSVILCSYAGVNAAYESSSCIFFVPQNTYYECFFWFGEMSFLYVAGAPLETSLFAPGNWSLDTPDVQKDRLEDTDGFLREVTVPTAPQQRDLYEWVRNAQMARDEKRELKERVRSLENKVAQLTEMVEHLVADDPKDRKLKSNAP